MRSSKVLFGNLFLIIISCAVVLFSIYRGDDKFIIMGLSFIPLVLISIPSITQKEFDPFTPLSLLFFIVLFSVTLRSIYIVFSEDSVISFFLENRSYDSLILGTLVIALSIFCYSLGYMYFNRSKYGKIKKLLLDINNANKKRLNLVVFLALTTSTCFSIFYISQFSNSLTLETLSAKRFIQVGDSYTSLSYLIWGASISKYIFYILISYYYYGKFKLNSFLGYSMIIAGAESLIIPAFSSSRAAIIAIFLYVFFAYHTFKKPLKISNLIYILMLVLFILTFFGGLRAVSQGQADGLGDIFNLDRVLEAVLKNRNLLDVSKTGYIIENIPEKLDFQYGSTLLAWLVGFVPRSLWEQKPAISLGPLIGKAIYDDPSTRITGTPPGFIAELYLNFGYLGIIVGMAILGAFVRVVQFTFSEELQNKNIFASMVYFFVIFNFSFRLFSGNFSSIMLKTITEVVSIYILSFFIKFKSKTKKIGIS